MAAVEKTPDQWDAEDIIEGLKPFRGISAPSTDMCHAHTNALIWIVRRLDLEKSDPWTFLARVSPWTALFVLIGWLAWLFTK
jgi:hypothetical protein